MKPQKQTAESGQAIVEFALVLPIALLILCAIVDFGWVFTHELVLSTAVRNGARAGVIYAEERDFETKVQNRVRSEADLCDARKLRVTARYTGTDVIVSADYDLQLLTPTAKLLFGAMNYHVKASCTMSTQ